MLFLLFVLGLTAGIQDLCSSQNTAHNSGNFSIFQSNGLCQNFCSDQNYALAIVRGKHCWCSNTSPFATVDISSCNEPCPGYPYEGCGNSDEELFGYIEIGVPSNTASPSSSESTTLVKQSEYFASSASSTSGTSNTILTPSSSTIEATSESYASMTSTRSSPSIYSSPSPSTTFSSRPLHGALSSMSSTPTSSHRSTFSTSSITSEKVAHFASSSLAFRTESLRTHTTTSSTSASSDSSAFPTVSVEQRPTGTDSAVDANSSHADTNAAEGSSSHDAFLDNTGKVAGVFTVVGVVGFGIAALAVKLLFVCCRRRSRQADSDVENSSSGIMRKEVDPRLEPSALYAQEVNDYDSETSLVDCKDYSRRCLTVVNPDYPESAKIKK